MLLLTVKNCCCQLTLDGVILSQFKCTSLTTLPAGKHISFGSALGIPVTNVLGEMTLIKIKNDL